jgi:LysM repeat protein
MVRFFACTGVAILLGGIWSPWPVALAQGGPAPKTVTTVTVKRGDTLEGIAKSNGVSAADLKRINGLKDADLLQVGQTLRLPAPGGKGLVVVKSGDTLESIAKANNTTAAALQKANPGIQPTRLKVGGTLRLPSAPAAAAPPVKAGAPSPKGVPAAPGAAPPVAPLAPAVVPPPAQLPPPAISQEKQEKSRWRYYGDTVVDWGGWKRLPDGVRYTLVQPAANDVGETRAQATAIAVDCSSLRHNWRVKDAWETWSIPAPRSVGQQIVLDLCGNAMGGERRQVPAPPSPKP